MKTIMLETWFCDNYNYHIIDERNKPLEMLVIQRALKRLATWLKVRVMGFIWIIIYWY